MRIGEAMGEGEVMGKGEVTREGKWPGDKIGRVKTDTPK